MRIHLNIEIIGTALFLQKEKTLILSDFHLGYEEALVKKGILIPKSQFRQIIEKLEIIFKKTGKVKKVILNGDLKHEFGTILNSEWRDVIKLIEFIKKYSDEIVIIKGNHDTILFPIAKQQKIEIVNHKKISDVLILHGDILPKIIDKDVKTIIIGHEHPAIAIRDGARVETFKCFLKGEWKKRTLIVMPSTNPLVEGTDILNQKLLSPFLKKGVLSFEVFVADDKTYYFGKVKDLPN